jgi:sugar lactone lactonase YvrE
LYEDFLPLPYSWKPWLWRFSVTYRFVVQRYKSSLEQAGKLGGFAERDLAFFKNEIRAIESLAKERGMDFLCVILPMLEPFDQYPYEKQHKDMHRMLDGIDFTDLLPHMRAYDVRELWFRPEDHHLNDRANLGVARMILSELQERGMVRLKPGTLPADPMGPLYGPGDLVVTDMDADPLLRGKFHGALFRVDPADGGVDLVSADPALREPVDLVFDPSGDLLVLDGEADPRGLGQSGAVFRINRYTGRATVELTSERFDLPNSLLLDERGRLFISDKKYNPLGLDSETGALLVFDPEEGKVRVLASGPEFVAPGPIAFAPNNRLYFIDADSNPNEVLDPSGKMGTPGVLFEVDRDTGEFNTLIAFKDTVSPVGIVSLEDGCLIVIDANADPLGLGYAYYPGGLVLVNPVQKTYEFLMGSAEFRDPIRGALGLDGHLYFVDANADPKKLGPDGAGRGVTGHGHGAVWRFDLEKRVLTLTASVRVFVNPSSLKVVPETFSD